MEEVRGSSPLKLHVFKPLVRRTFVIMLEAFWLVGLASAYQSADELTNVRLKLTTTACSNRIHRCGERATVCPPAGPHQWPCQLQDSICTFD